MKLKSIVFQEDKSMRNVICKIQPTVDHMPMANCTDTEVCGGKGIERCKSCEAYCSQLATGKTTERWFAEGLFGVHKITGHVETVPTGKKLPPIKASDFNTIR